MKLPNRWASQLSSLAAWLGGALLLGLWFGAVSWWLVGALGLYVAYVLRQVYQLDRMLAGDKRARTFRTRGLWAEMSARADKLRAKARNRKKKYHRLLREVWDSTGVLRDGGIILNADHEILWCNPAAARLLGLDPSRDLGNRIDNLVRHPAFVRHLDEPKGEDVTIPSPIRQDAWLSVTLIPYGQNQRLAIVRDVTRQVKLETMRRDFIANASHELRSPLTVISGYLDSLAEEGDLPQSLAGPVGEMQRQAERMTQILTDLIELTRLESAEAAAREEFVDIGGMLQQIVDEFSKRAQGRRIELHLESDAALLGKEVELHSIAYNLIENAVRFTPPSGRIDITWRSTDRRASGEVLASADAEESAPETNGAIAPAVGANGNVHGEVDVEPQAKVHPDTEPSADLGALLRESADSERPDAGVSTHLDQQPSVAPPNIDAESKSGAKASVPAEAKASVPGGSEDADADAGAGIAIGGGAELIVADTGIGIPSDQISRVTERFYRIELGRSRATGGTGLGLAIVKHALERHGATLEIQSEEGQGSTFICRFPASRVVRRADDAMRHSERAIG